MSPRIRGRRDARTKLHSPDDVMTLTEHLGELRVRIIRSVLAVALFAILIIAFYDQVLDFLRGPYDNFCRSNPDTCGVTTGSGGELIINDPLDGLSTRMRIGGYGGILLATPVILWQVWRFIVPALHAKEKKYAIPFIASSVALFALGSVIAYFTLEAALDFLISWSGDDVTPLFQVGRYIRLVMLMIGAFGVGLQFPLLLVFLQLVGVLTPQQLLQQWRYAIVAIFVIAAVITPSGDPISLVALAAPMLILYIASIVIGRLVQRRRRKAAEAA